VPRVIGSGCVLALAVLTASAAHAATRIRIMPPDRGDFVVGQRFDLRVEATSDAGGQPPRGLKVSVNGADITARNILDAGENGERGFGGTGVTSDALPASLRAAGAPPHSSNFLLRDYAFTRAGTYVIAARTTDGAQAEVTVRALPWQSRPGQMPRARNIIFLLGDGMGLAHRTAARIVSRGVKDGKARTRLAMDTMDATGQVMTFALNSVITDSAPGMAAYSTGQKGNNNTEGVFPDNTGDPFDNPRIEYIGEFLRRQHGAGFNVGIVTTAEVTDATPGANAVHTSDRNRYVGIAQRFFDERQRNGVTVLMGGGAQHFRPKGVEDGTRPDQRNLVDEYTRDGYHYLRTRAELTTLMKAGRTPGKLLGLFDASHMPVAFDKVGAGTYSQELGLDKNRARRDEPMLDEMAQLALNALASSSPKGFYLLIEGASIDKRAHAADPERTIWDTIEFDNAVRIALDFAERTNRDRDPANDTLVIVTADHETGGMGIIAVGNDRFTPQRLGEPVRDYAAVFRFNPDQQLDFHPNYTQDAHGFPTDPDPSRKLLLGWAAAPDRFENWISNRLMQEAAIRKKDDDKDVGPAIANPLRDGSDAKSDNRTAQGKAIPGFLVAGTIENGEHACDPRECPGDTAPEAHKIAGHTGSDVLLTASGAGAVQFIGTYDNTDVFVKMVRAAFGSYDAGPFARPSTPARVPAPRKRTPPAEPAIER